jgi:hypothetical protein
MRTGRLALSVGRCCRAGSQPSSITYGSNGNKRWFGYDDLHRLTTDELKTSGRTAIASIAYGYAANDNLTSKPTVGFGGTVSNTYTYDLADRLPAASRQVTEPATINLTRITCTMPSSGCWSGVVRGHSALLSYCMAPTTLPDGSASQIR